MNKNTVILITDSPVLNLTLVEPYQNLSVEYSVYLNSSLLSNWFELFSGIRDEIDPIILLSEEDKEYIPRKFIPKKFTTMFYSGSKLLNFSEDLFQMKRINDSKVMILFINSIGLTQSYVLRVYNLIHAEEASLVIGKSNRDRIIFCSTYGIDNELVNSLFITKRNYNEYLGLVTAKDIFIHTVGGFLSIDDFEDIKKLYIELSKKESLSYCSPNMHARFNDVFVDYKELLNV